MTQKIKEIIKDKYWIVEGQYGKVGTLRKVDEGYEFFDQNNNKKGLGKRTKWGEKNSF